MKGEVILLVEQPLQGRTNSRKLDPSDILLPPGYKIDVFANGLTTPINITFTDQGDILVADSGITDGNGKVLKLTKEGFTVIADGFNPPLTGITEYQGNIYVSHRRYITLIQPDGTKKDIIEGLPSNGDHHNNRVVFSGRENVFWARDGNNSGVVGKDNDWVKEHPFFHDYPGGEITLRGQDFKTSDFLSEDAKRQLSRGPMLLLGFQATKTKRLKA